MRISPSIFPRLWRVSALSLALLALLGPVAQAAPVQLSFTGVSGNPYLGFVPAVPVGTAVRYQVQFEDRFSDGDFSDWRDALGPVTGWAEIGADRYLLDGDRWRGLSSSFTGEQVVGFALTGTGPLTTDGDLFEGIWVSYSNFSGWHGGDALGYRRPFVGGGASFGYVELAGTTTVTAVPAPGSVLLVLAGLAALSRRLPSRPRAWAARAA